MVHDFKNNTSLFGRLYSILKKIDIGTGIKWNEFTTKIQNMDMFRALKVTVLNFMFINERNCPKLNQSVPL